MCHMKKRSSHENKEETLPQRQYNGGDFLKSSNGSIAQRWRDTNLTTTKEKDCTSRKEEEK